MKKGILLLLLLGLFVPKSIAQVDTSGRRNNIKLNLPLGGKGIFSNWILAGMQYERRLDAKSSFSLGAVFYTSDRNYSFIGRKQHNEFVILPQWRYYLRRNKENYFNGFFLGASTMYLHSITRQEMNAQTEKRNYFGAGILIGYQQVIKRRVSIGLTPALHLGRDQSTRKTSYDQRRVSGALFVALVEAYVGFIF